MKKASVFAWRPKYLHCLLAVLVLCLFLVVIELPKLFIQNPFPPASTDLEDDNRKFHMVNNVEWRHEASSLRQKEEVAVGTQQESFKEPEALVSSPHIHDLNFDITSNFSQNAEKRLFPDKQKGNAAVAAEAEFQKTSPKMSLKKAIQLAWKTGRKTWKELLEEPISDYVTLWQTIDARVQKQPCIESAYMTGREFQLAGRFMSLPCGVMVGTSVTILGKLRPAHIEYKRTKDGTFMAQEVSHFVMELHGAKETKSDESVKVLHVNPRLKGDWSNKSVIEVNTCYRGQWGRPQRCDGSLAGPNEVTVDGLLKCENWQHDFGEDQNESKTSWWLHRLVGQVERPSMRWHYPFKQGHLFVLTVMAGWEGYHISVDGKHVTSFPYRTGSLDEEITGVYVNGEVNLHSVVVSSLPSVHPKSLEEELFQASENLRAPPLPDISVDLFIGIISASSHFTERMAVRNTWMQSESIKNSRVVARFFVALHQSRYINLQVMREANYYKDIVILPFIDHYDIVVLKTIAICEYAVQNVSAKYILKCDDDTFVRVEAVLDEVKKVGYAENLYLGSMNVYHRPLRTGKWAVTVEEWPEAAYPPYANGAGYIISYNIAKFVVSQHKRKNLELFKMEDVSMGLWVMRYNTTDVTKYVHTWKFYQPGCENGCVTAHYQSPRQMLCMWKKLSTTAAYCCQ